MAISEAVLLMAGAGNRMQQVTRGRSKLLLPIYDRTLAAHACQWLVESGLRRIVIVTAPRDFDDLYPQLAEFSDVVELQYVFQAKPTGTADALALALPHLHSDQLLCLFADNVFEGTLTGASMARLADGKALRTHVVWTTEGLDELAVVLTDHAQSRLVRKPHSVAEGAALTGLFVVLAEAFAAFHAQPVTQLGERDLLDFVDDSIRRGVAEVVRLDQRWIDAASSFESLWRAGNLVRDTRLGLSAGGAP